MNIYITILLMAVVTYLPRMLPMVALGNKKLSGFSSRMLKFIPIATLTALVIPSVFTATSKIESSVAGLICAVVLSLFKRSLIIIVLGSIAAALLAGMVF